MKKNLLVLTISCAMTVTYGQTTFQKTFGGTSDEISSSIQSITDKGFIISGSTNSFGSGNYDVSLIKIDSTENILWSKTYGGTNYEHGNHTIQTADGGFIISGHKVDSFLIGDVYLVKTDSNGNLLWSKTYGGTNDDSGYDVKQTTDGGFIILGRTESFGAGYSDVYLIKIDSIGNMLWSKTFGGTYNDYGYSVQQTMDGGFAVVGSTIGFGPGFSSIYLLKINSTGNLLWSKTYGGSGDNYGYSFQQTLDGGFIITGYFSNNFGAAGNNYVYLLKTDSNGVLLWSKIYDGTFGHGTSVKQTMNGEFVISAVTDTIVQIGPSNWIWLSDNTYFLKTDSNGVLLWSKIFGGSNIDQFNTTSFQQTIDGGFIISGSTHSFSINYNSDIYLIKTDSNGDSGCNEINTIIGTSIPATTTLNPVTIQNTPLTIVGNPSTFVSSGGTTNILCLTGINESNTEQEESTVYPNPFSSTTTLQTDKFFKDAILTVYNSFGQSVKQVKNVSGQSITLHRDNLPIGLYFIRMVEDSKVITTDKLVITD